MLKSKEILGRIINFFLRTFGICLLLYNTIAFAQESKILLKTDFNGQITEGSINHLIEAVQQGEAIRIGWQLDFNDDNIPDLEHWIDANFLSILNGQVFNQIEPIYAQIPNDEIPQVEISNSSLKWTAVIGSNGKLISRYIISDLNEIEDEDYREEMRKMLEPKERNVQTIWVKK